MPRTLKKPSSSNSKPKKKSSQGPPKRMMEVDTPAPVASNPAVWRPGVDTVGEDEQLEYDPTAYDTLHALTLEWPCLSFDICRDDLGGPRSTFPHTMFFVAGTQAATKKQNSITLVKLTSLGHAGHGKKAAENAEDDSDDSDDDGDEDESSDEDEMAADKQADGDKEAPPKMHYRIIPHMGGVNRVRAMPQSSGIVAVWSDTAEVKVYDFTNQLKELAQEAEPKPPKSAKQQINPLQTHSHSTEGFAVDWSPVKQGLLVTGDCRSKMYVWSPQEGGKWAVAGSYTGHEGSVEDLQWSPTEETVFASCSVDQTIRIWDTREKSKPMITVKAYETDVNVISWNRLVTYMLASGGDDGVLKIWDLRAFADGNCVSQFKYHTKAITAVEWCPYESSMLLTVSADNQVGSWDLALERDPEEETALAAEGNAMAPEDLPPQLLFAHSGQHDLKEAHWHSQIPGMIISTAADGMNVYKPANL